MTSDSTSPPEPRRLPLWPFAVLALAVVWSVVLRVPLVLNARAHLDGDLAVDGLTLLDMTKGVFRWHYPGTPHIGIAPAFASLPQAWIWGATSETLVSGGLVIQALVMIACFVLSWRCDGPSAACWSLLPLTFASTGLIWLSGRITGGHLLSVAMHAGVFIGLQLVLTRPGLGRAFGLGVWSGLALWVDSMGLLSVAAMLASAALAWWRSGHSPKAFRLFGIGLLGFALGIVPKGIGGRVDPYDSYREQFQPIWETPVLLQHGGILFRDCLPRLVAGHRIFTLQSDPLWSSIPTFSLRHARESSRVLDETTAHLSLLLFGLAVGFAARGGWNDPSATVRFGLLLSGVLVIVGFILNRNIFNADNYRYLVFLIPVWSLGTGRLFHAIVRKGTGGAAAGLILAVAFAAVMTLDARLWYERFGWLEGRRPIVPALEEPVLDWLNEHPEVDVLSGSYWQGYKIAFLTAGRVKGIPYPIFPNRFPEWSKGLPGGHARFLFSSRDRESLNFRVMAQQAGGVDLLRTPQGNILTWPSVGLTPPQ